MCGSVVRKFKDNDSFAWPSIAQSTAIQHPINDVTDTRIPGDEHILPPVAATHLLATVYLPNPLVFGFASRTGLPSMERDWYKKSAEDFVDALIECVAAGITAAREKTRKI